MRQARFSPQDLDPIGALTARMMAIVLSIGAVVVALGMLIVTAGQVGDAIIQLAAFACICLAAAILIWFSDPYRAPFGRRPAIAFFAFCVAAAALDALSRAGTNISLRDDWPSVSIALLVLMLGSYRPVRETVGLVLLTTLALAVIAVVESIALPPLEIGLGVIVVAAPVLAAGVSTVVFSHHLVADLLAWRRDSASAQRDAIDSLRSDLIPSVRAERLELLESDVLPFLREVLSTGVLTPQSSDTARDLAAGLREVMTSDSGGNWLEELTDSVDDPERLLERLGGEQRGSLRALLIELRMGGFVAPGSTSVSVHSQDRLAQAVITAQVLEPSALKTSLAPYFAVARGFLLEATLHIDHEHFLLEFRFDVA